MWWSPVSLALGVSPLSERCQPFPSNTLPCAPVNCRTAEANFCCSLPVSSDFMLCALVYKCLERL